jgi:hypothetical protein
MGRLRLTLAVGAAAMACALGLGIVYFAVAGSRLTDLMSWGLFLGVAIALTGFVIAAVGHLSHSNVSLSRALGLPDFGGESEAAEDADERETPADTESDVEDAAGGQDSEEPSEEGEQEREADPSEVDWPSALAAQGRETRLGDSLADIVQRERGGPLAAVVVVSDGQRNAGIECAEAVALANDAAISFHTVGMGSDEVPTNVRLVDVQAPPRVFPRDAFPITVYVRGDGLQGRRVKVELSSAVAPADGEEEPSFDFEAEQDLTLGSASVDEAAGDVVDSIKFPINPEDEGKRLYRVRVEQLEEEADLTDNEKTITVEVVERKNKVLLLADGPTREYRFLRNMLHRDNAVTLHVYLQSAAVGISQEADTILEEFPMTEAELFEEYDCIVAFDPDWLALDLDQLRLLDRWVAEKAGGLIVIAGPVHTTEWVPKERDDERVKLLKGLYPVVFDRWRFAGGKEMASDVTSRPDFTREGQNAEFLWLDDDPVASEEKWTDFDGVYGYFNVLSIREPKPGATVYARLSADVKTEDEELPPYMVGHFYGAGHVFFLGSGEMWRMRAANEEYFETFYTKLIRHVSQGRLLRDSSRGVLMVGKPRCVLGDTVVVRAQLSDRQFRPLTIPEVEAILVMPDGTRVPFVLKAVQDAPRPGLYAEQYTALVEGDYRIELMLPDSEIGELLTRNVQVRAPKLEIERPQRNDVLLKEISRRTGGEYYVGLDAALGRRGAPPLSSVIEPNNVSTTLAGTPDTDFQRLLMAWLLAAICGALALEWLIRRLSKLA